MRPPPCPEPGMPHFPPRTEASPQIDAQAQQQKITLLVRGARAAAAVTVINASLVAFVNATSHTPVAAALIWWGVMVGLSAARCVLAHWLAGNPAGAANAWQHPYIGATALVAAIWGAGSVLFMWHAPDGALMFTGLVLCGMVAGAVSLLGAVPAAFRAYTLLVGVPASAVVLLQADSALRWSFGAASLVFLAAMLARARSSTNGSPAGSSVRTASNGVASSSAHLRFTRHSSAKRLPKRKRSFFQCSRAAGR